MRRDTPLLRALAHELRTSRRMQSASSPLDENKAVSEPPPEGTASGTGIGPGDGDSRLSQFLLMALLGLFAAALGATAWVSDDAFITFRVVDNALAGHGLVWNVGERVQAYTHPLWMLLLLLFSAPLGEIYFASLLLGGAATAAALGLLVFRVRASAAAAALALAFLIGSRAFVDYSTSGLENPLSHLLLALLFVVCSREGADSRTQRIRIALASLCALTRLDLAFLVLPLLGWAFLRDGVPRVRIWLIGALPFVAWEAFSLLYYGAFIANSARAKLTAGVDGGLLLEQGFRYFAVSLRSDPLSVVLLLIGPLFAFARRDSARWAVSGGILAHCAWVVSNGGDFMQGRFLTPALFLSAVLVARSAVLSAGVASALACSTALCAVLVPYLSPFAARDYGEDWHAAIDAYGVSDERHFHREISGLLSAVEETDEGLELAWQSDEDRGRAQRARDIWFADPWLASLETVGVLDERGLWPPADATAAVGMRPVLVKGGVGLFAYRLGPSVYVIDYHGLGDPLLARLPALPRDPVLAGMIPRLASLPWRVGHYLRPVPSGYALTRSLGENHIADPDLAEFFDRIQLVVSGPIASIERFAAILDLQSSASQARMDAWVERTSLYRGGEAAAQDARAGQ